MVKTMTDSYTKEKIMDIAEVSAEYPDQWVLMEITGKDDSGFPKEGEVIVHSDSKKEVLQEAKTLIKRSKGENRDVYWFHTDPITHNAA